MKKTYRPYEPKQSFLLPPSLLDWLPDGHPARFILDVVERLNLTAIGAYYEREQRGYPPHHPQMMVALVLYGYCVGVPSSRKIERRTYEDVAFRVIAGNTHPDHTCISEFRRIPAERDGIVAQAVTNQPPDVEHLIPMIDRIVFNCGEARRFMRGAR